MNAVTTRMAMFRSRGSEWRHARRFVEEFCAGAGLPRDTCLKACLVLEELFVNTVKHGHAGGSDAPVWVGLAGEDGHLTLTYEDLAAPFNPFSRERREILEALAPTRREGGLGVILAQGLAARADYAYLYGRNRVQVTLA
jgi:anti-sigma regulatory factor (Ser/Thr protein kinase)